MSEELRKSAILMRNALGALDLSQMQTVTDAQDKMSDEDIQNRANDAELFLKTHFRDVLAKMIIDQVKLISIGITLNDSKKTKIQVETEGQLLFGRGFLLGLLTVADWFDAESKTALGRFHKPEKPEEGESSVPPVGTLEL